MTDKTFALEPIEKASVDELRALLRGAHTHSLDEQLDLERDVQSRLGFTHDYIEGVTAFLQKRPAQFRGE